MSDGNKKRGRQTSHRPERPVWASMSAQRNPLKAEDVPVIDQERNTVPAQRAMQRCIELLCLCRSPSGREFWIRTSHAACVWDTFATQPQLQNAFTHVRFDPLSSIFDLRLLIDCRSCILRYFQESKKDCPVCGHDLSPYPLEMIRYGLPHGRSPRFQIYFCTGTTTWRKVSSTRLEPASQPRY